MPKSYRPRIANRFAVRVGETDPFSHDSTAAAVRHLTELVEAQARVIRNYEAGLARSREIFERASAAARLGIWECDLTTETLHWSAGTYDMFDISRGAPLVRKQTLTCYPAHSLKTLEAIRSRAIARRESFNLDAEILTGKGHRRWIRITAMVDCAGDRPRRLSASSRTSRMKKRVGIGRGISPRSTISPDSPTAVISRRASRKCATARPT